MKLYASVVHDASDQASISSGSGVRASAQLAASVRLIGKTVILALEVAEIVGFGLALL